MPRALITGGSRGLGNALATALAADGWQLVLTGRDTATLARAGAALGAADVTTVAGDVADPAHRAALAAHLADQPLDLLVNNASTLGPLPRPALLDAGADALTAAFHTNVAAPIALVAALRHLLVDGATVVNVTSDAAVEAWPGWGPYGATKAALEHASAVLAVEEPGLRVLAVDPGDLRTDLHQAAFPGEDIGDRPLPRAVVPAFLALLEGDRPSGRVRLADVAVPATTDVVPPATPDVAANADAPATTDHPTADVPAATR